MTLPDKIIKLRKAYGWSQEDFAEKLNVSRQAISRWENGTALPDAQNVLQISKLFHVTTDYLLKDDDESDGDIPAVQTEAKQTKDLFTKKKPLHLIAAISFTIASLCWLINIVFYMNPIHLGLSCISFALCAVYAGVQFSMFAKKRQSGTSCDQNIFTKQHFSMDRTLKFVLVSLTFNITFAIYHLVLGLISLKKAIRFREWLFSWQGQKDSNPRPTVLETATLPAELYPYDSLIISHTGR